MSTITFQPLNKNNKEFTVTLDENGDAVKAEGINLNHVKFMMKGGRGLDGLIRAKSWTHAPIEKEDEVSEEDEQEETAKGDILKTDDDRRLAFGWAYVSHDANGTVVIDKSGEFVSDVRELEEAAYGFVSKAQRPSGLMHQRTTENLPVVVGQLVESIVFTPEKIAKMGIPPGTIPQGAWWVGFKVDEATWPDIKSGKYSSFSISGKAIKKAV